MRLAILLLILANLAFAETKTLVVSDMRVSPTAAPLIHRVNPEGDSKTLTFIF